MTVTHIDLLQGWVAEPTGRPLCGATSGPVDPDLEYNSEANCEACFTAWDIRNELEASSL